ncbi:CBO0543 family protein [Anaeromicrobium sediminis]|uniref:Uncharacterized protein n=1 Tax=Anaeromicrobium sediminis TaxID=1478221 RepID=A0A267MJD9_9FIRM|nr:CBO0543 family protein [Anaeromicrobium sediminis]PAB59567.1 hypothetical protein CCE28_10160 [Anaeromicrobium sediminis]
MNSQYPSWEHIVELRIKLRDANLSYWFHHDLFSFGWWIIVFLTIAPWIIWWKLVNKSRLTEILLYGSFISILTTVLDVLGATFVLWGYPTMLEPGVPPMVPANLSVFPVGYMLLYQYFPKWIKFLIAATGMSFIFSFIGEPVLAWLNIYENNNWKSIYSFPIYIIIALFFKYIIERIISRQRIEQIKK